MALAEKSLSLFLEEVARTSPTVPAGGCVVGLAGALAASLGRLVCALTSRKADDPGKLRRLRAMGERLELLQRRCLALMDQDMEACESLFQAKLRLSRARSGRGDQGGLKEAARALVEPPVALARCGLELLRIALELVEQGNPTARADAGVAAEMANGCARGGLWIARANLGALEEGLRKSHAETLDHLEVQLEALYGRVSQEMGR
jgi:formiminotetrahydrofolate cyclodeaminase